MQLRQCAVIIATAISQPEPLTIKCQKRNQNKIRLYQPTIRILRSKAPLKQDGLRGPLPENQRIATRRRFRKRDLPSRSMKPMAEWPQIHLSGQRPDRGNNLIFCLKNSIQKPTAQPLLLVRRQPVTLLCETSPEVFFLLIERGNLWSRQSRWSFQPS